MGSRFTAEEAGYNQITHSLTAAACKVGKQFPEIYISEVPTEDLGIGTLSVLQEKLQNLEATLPPAGLETLHSSLIETVLAQKDYLCNAREQENCNPRNMTVHSLPEALDQLATSAATTCTLYEDFYATARQRPPRPELGPEVMVSFVPLGLPVEVGVSSTEGFYIELSGNIATPIGTFSASAASTSGRRNTGLLVIRHAGRQRVLSLDRPFRLSVPAEYGVSFINTREALIAEVDEMPLEPNQDN